MEGKEIKIVILSSCNQEADLMQRELARGEVLFSARVIQDKEEFILGAKEFSPDIILIDYSLSSFSFKEALEITKEKYPQIPIIIISETIDEQLFFETLEKGVVDCLFKDKLFMLAAAVKLATKNKKYNQQEEYNIEGKHEKLEKLILSKTEELSKAKDYLGKIINAVGNPIFVKDRKHRWVLLNDALCEFMGYKREELIGKSDFDFFPKEEAEVFWQKDELVFSSGQVNINEEKFTDSQGVLHTILTKKMLYKDKSGQEYIVGIITDITDRKRMEEELLEHRSNLEGLVQERTDKLEKENVERKRAEEKLQRLVKEWQITFDAVNDMIWVLDREGRIIRLNKTTEKFFNLSENEILGRYCWEVMHGRAEPKPECLVVCMHNALRRKTVNTKIGQRWFDIAVDPVLDDQGRLVEIIHIARDVTDRKDSEKALLKEREKAVRLELEKLTSLGKLAASVAHELRNPLSAINNAIYYLNLSGLDADEKTKQKHFDIVKRQTEIADGVISSFLEYGRPKELELEEVEISQLIDEVISEIKVSKNIEVQKKYKGNKNLKLMLDPLLIKQVFSNIITNSMQAIKGTGRIDIVLEKEPTQVKIDITDNGVGINKEDLKKVFEPLFSTKVKGKGLGMAVVKDIVERHAGSIFIDSQPDKGTKTIVTLPLGERIR